MTDQERTDFIETTMPCVAMIGDQQVVLQQKRFSSGSVGWHGNAKIDVHGCRVQCNLILTIVGSKPVTISEQDATKVVNRVADLLGNAETSKQSSNGKPLPKRPKGR